MGDSTFMTPETIQEGIQKFIMGEGRNSLVVAVKYWMNRLSVPIQTYDDVFADAVVFVLEKTEYDPSRSRGQKLAEFLFQWTRYSVLSSKTKQLSEKYLCTARQYEAFNTFKRNLRRLFPADWQEKMSSEIAHQPRLLRNLFFRIWKEEFHVSCHNLVDQERQEDHISYLDFKHHREDPNKEMLLDVMGKAISKLPLRYQELIRKHFFEGEKMMLIAQQRRVTRQRVAQLIKEACQELRKLLQE